jgi:hypothetical protein
VVANHLPLPIAAVLVPALALLRAGVKAPAELAAGRPEHARAHLAAARDGVADASRALVRRARGRVIPPGAEPG